MVKPLPVKLWDGGIDAIPRDLQYMRDEEVSGEKLCTRSRWSDGEQGLQRMPDSWCQAVGARAHNTRA